MEMNNKLNTTNFVSSFETDNVRRIWNNGQWWFSIIDVVGFLSQSNRPKKYWSDIKRKDTELNKIETSAFFGRLKMISPDGKNRLTDCANLEGILRIIQSIPSPKAEPFNLGVIA